MKNDGLSIDNVAFIEQLYETWQRDESSLPDDWRAFFSNLSKSDTEDKDLPQKLEETNVYKQGRVDSLMWAYRDVGYLHADLNPLHGYITPELRYLVKTIEGSYETLDAEAFGLSPEDMDTEFRSGRGLTPPRGPLKDILSSLRETYCAFMGVEILHIQNRTMRSWLIEKIEQNNNRPVMSPAQKRTILEDLIKAEELEQFVHTNFIGQKRFSLEGGESLIPALHHLIDTAARREGVQEIVLGMAHRGRLNVLTNLMHKPEEEILSRFEDRSLPNEVGASGDVKYHLGYSTDHVNDDGSTVHVSLVANPSHLEAVDPVVEGKARSSQRRIGDTHRKKVIPVLVHGDAAITGQGVVAETFNLSQLRGYKTGGTIHIIINNQIGFTTASRDARSTFFCTDVAKSLPVPIFHVNGDHPEYVVRAIDLAIRYRQKFGYDAVVDIICYRKYGHNEADDPSFTHPIMYRSIEKAKNIADQYGGQLDEQGVYTTAQQEQFRETYLQFLKRALENARKSPAKYGNDGFKQREWQNFKKDYDHTPVNTSVPEDILLEVGRVLTSVPDEFQAHRKLTRIMDGRRKMLDDGEALDWSTAEALAFGSLVLEGTSIRLSGEDSARGTFSQRHAVWWDTATDKPEPYLPLDNLPGARGKFHVYDSPLSEFSVLGFEYGNALSQPDLLVLWEAQFGDFCNGAQVIIDQFIAAGESKWDRGCGLVMLLPHGYEGQGPEHSSAHLERFLQLCAEDNLQVCYPTSPAQYFHLLRRQLKRPFRKPLIIMTPKSLLRSKDATSGLKDFSKGGFLEVLDDPADSAAAETLIFCSGKIFYDLKNRRDAVQSSAAGSSALIRIEQLYPFPETQLAAVLKKYKKANVFIWAQEESKNRGAWTFVHERKASFAGERELRYVGRAASASPATGSFKKHQLELDEILDSLFG